MKVLMSPALARQIEAHLERAYPDEGAGFLLGYLRDSAFHVEAVLPMENHWQEGDQRRRFALTGEDALKGELEAERRGLAVIGVFHSHPDHPAEPSQWDVAWASWPNFAYLITSVVGNGDGGAGKAQITRAWRLREDRSRFEEDVLEIQRSEEHTSELQSPTN